jgi:hypothetical protein
LTSSSKRYCALNVVSHDCVSMCVKKNYGLHCHMLGTHSFFHKHLILCLHLAQILAPRILRKILSRLFLIISSIQHSTNSTWVGLRRCPHQHSPPVAETWALSIGITFCIDTHRSVFTTSNRNQVAFCQCIHFYKQSFFVTDHVLADFCLYFQKTVSMKTTRRW